MEKLDKSSDSDKGFKYHIRVNIKYNISLNPIVWALHVELYIL